MSTYGVFRSDNMKCTKDGAIRSAKYYVSTTQTAIENGNIVQVNELLSASTDREVFKAIAPANLTDVNLGIVASPEIIYDEDLTSGQALDQYINAAGKVVTVLMPQKGDIFSISDACITVIDDDDDVVSVGNYLTNTAGTTKFTEKTSLGGTETLAVKVIARELYKSGKYLNVCQVIKAN